MKSIFLGLFVASAALIALQNRAASFIDVQDHFHFGLFLSSLSIAPREETFRIPADNSIPHLIAFLPNLTTPQHDNLIPC